jgi:hypothetical protein
MKVDSFNLRLGMLRVAIANCILIFDVSAESAELIVGSTEAASLVFTL